jgi:hypothetical protein
LADDADLSAVAWPGFVDILSAVVIMFVFFMMIVATALYFHIIIFKSMILANPEQSQKKIESEIKDIIAQVQSEFAQSVEQEVRVDSDFNQLYVFFGLDAISILPQTLEQINEHVSKHFPEKERANYIVRIIACKNPRTLENAARKIAVARMLNIRNIMMKNNFESRSVLPKVVDGEEVNGSYHWVKIEFERK